MSAPSQSQRAADLRIVRTPAISGIHDDRFEIIDALNRYAAGQDLHDAELLASAFSPDAELDFARGIPGVELPRIKGRDSIVAAIQTALADIDTRHTVTNTRIEIQKDTASLYVLVDARQRLRSGSGGSLLLKNFYWITLRRQGSRWAITKLRVENAWHSGEPKTLFT